MEIAPLIKLFRAQAQAIHTALAKFNRLGQMHKTASYKKRRVSEATELWNAVNNTIKSLDKLMITPDEIYEEEKGDVLAAYKEYTDGLLKIKDDVIASGTIDEDLELYVRKQDVRFEALGRIVEDIQDKIESQAEISMAYCKAKLKNMNECWSRIRVDDENILFDRKILPGSYNEKFDDLEKSVEKMELFLYEQIETPVTRDKKEGVRVPRVQIPKFHGDYFKWVSFRDLFVSVVKDNGTLSNAEKMQILKTNVNGEAEALIADLTISDVNFECAWQRLLSRYDNTRVVVYKHMNKLMNQQPGKTESKSLKQILDTTDQVLLALQNLGRPVDHWDDWVIVLVTQKLSDECRKDWERKIGSSTALPKWNQLKEFLEEEFRMLEGIENVRKKEGKNKEKHPKTEDIKSYQTSIDDKICAACDGEHGLFTCTVFKGMDPKERWVVAKKKKLCFSCLKIHKDVLKCEKKKPCKKCSRKHSTWLHEGSRDTAPNQSGKTSDELVAAHSIISTDQVLLATLVISTWDVYGRPIKLRALVDSGSQGSLITERAVSLLQIKTIRSNKRVSGLCGSNSETARMVKLNMKPRFESSVRLEIDCYLLKRLTKNLPDHDLCTRAWPHLKGLLLGDPNFHKVGPVDLLLGTDVVAEILQEGLIKGESGKPMAQKTSFGWIVSGNINSNGSINSSPKKVINCLVSTQEQEQNDLSRFWEIEELNPKRIWTKDETACEKFYEETVTQGSDGTFTVKIPFKDQMEQKLGSSKQQCLARFLYLEKKFQRDAELRREYIKVMTEYIDLGHMVEITDGNRNECLYHIPHHAVVKSDSLTTKTRVVFDASAKTTTGVSLNECMHTGPKQQHDLLEILIRWRKHRVVFKADIEKMYRQIKLDKQDQKYHTIFWRNDPSEPIKEYQLTTVTFGTAAAPFLAIRTLIQIGLNNQQEFPSAAEAISKDFYVDDLISGCDSISEAIQRKDELLTALKSGGLQLRKWSSNSKKLLDTIPEGMTEKSLQVFSEEDTTKALGLRWNPTTDKFSFAVKWSPENGEVTKRQLLSEASKLFDPLGWLAPVIIRAKLMMQEVWASKIGWDEQVSPNIQEDWIQYRAQLKQLEKLQIDRWIGFQSNGTISIHGFCDASEGAYAAVVYTRMQAGSEINIKMIASKTRVSPMKTKLTLPRLELCGAVLLGNLIKTVKESMNLEGALTYAWCDSMITLGWLKGEPLKWKTFVANRVAEIQSQELDGWRYVKSEENPADCASRGLMPSELKTHPLWWTGPAWLSKAEEEWPSTMVEDHDLEKRTITCHLVRVEKNDVIEAFSSWNRLIRVTAYCRRMKHRAIGPLTVAELATAGTLLMKKCQEERFSREIADLRDGQPISKKSELKTLNPFLDDDGVLRVGGRLANAKISYARKHPIILPSRHQVTKLIVRQMHQDTLHGGPQLMRGLLQKKYWIIQCKRLVNNEFSRCVICKRYKAQAMEQMMGELPEARVTLERAFVHTGVDYAGPIEVKTSTLRNSKIVKGCVAIFVCMGTKAIHLELVSDKTTDAFMAAFDRFMARRGLVTMMYSDNGSNFQGCANRMDENLVKARNEEVAELVATRGVAWTFIPPGAPHFGGIWERGVRSMKDHLKKTLGTARLTFEEYGTVLCQIEACLNSRPLCPLTKEAENMNALTPGHFLIGDALLAPSQPSLLDNTVNRVKRWNYLQLLHQHFWNRWNTEYLTQLQQRHKWTDTAPNVQVGDLVLVKDEQLPPRNWLMGRILETNPGQDGKVRVASVKTGAGIMKRPIRKLCPLVSTDEETRMDDHQPASRPMRANGLVSTSMMVLLLILSILGGGLASSPSKLVTFQPFSHQAGIYFEDIGRAQLVKSEWHMILYFNLAQYYLELKSLQDATKKLQEMCEKAEVNRLDSHCGEIIRELQNRLKEIDGLNEILGANKRIGPGRTRQERAAPLNVVGWATHELFGIMAADQADHIEDQLTSVNENESHLLELIKNQTSIAEATVTLVKSTQDEINANYGKIHTALTVLTNMSDVNRKGERVLGWAMHISLLISRFEKMQERMVDMLTELQQGHVNSYIFTPQKFKEQLTVITSHLPDGCKLPDGPQHDMRSFYALIRGKIRVTKKNLLIDITIPLVTATDYQVFHVITVPTEYEGKYVAIVPDSKYLLVTLKGDNFYPMTEREYGGCLISQKSTHLCEINHPIWNAQSNQSRCERDLLNQKQELSPHCKYEVTERRDVWIQLHKRNHWIYGLKEKSTLNIVCRNRKMSETVQGSGIMMMSPGCEVTQVGLTIVAESGEISEGNIDFHPSFNLSDLVASTGNENNVLNLTINRQKEINAIHSQIQTMREQSRLDPIYHGTHYGISGTIMTILFGIIFTIWYKRSWLLQWFTSASDNSNVTDTNLEKMHELSANELIAVSSDASKPTGENVGTDERHRRGECPFRT